MSPWFRPSWFQSRAFTVALVTFATFTDIVAYSVAVPVLPDLSRVDFQGINGRLVHAH